MRTMSEITQEIKSIISLEVEESEIKSRKVLDIDVAKVLGISPSVLATSKNRNKMLYEEIILFCGIRALCANTLLLNQSPESLILESNKYLCHKYSLCS